ncbi:MAG TPA: hypothetical protein VHL34_02920 [Rhizomicrobium sp.]|jgi:hypothetical protein|nr:hypothetical protein [Rhizomicrobium sp.]
MRLPSIKTIVLVAERVFALLAGVLVIAVLVGLFVGVPAANGPAHPDKASGHVIPWSNHGAMHYMTVRQYDILVWDYYVIVWVAFAMGLGIILSKEGHNISRWIHSLHVTGRK